MTPDARLEVRDLPLPLRNTTGQRILRAPWEWAALGAILLAASGHLIIKLGLAHAVSTALPGPILGRILHYALNPVVLAGLAVYGTGTLLWIYAVSQRSISFLYPITALNYVIVATGGKFLFGEAVSQGRWAGIGIVVLGVTLMQFSGQEDKRK